MNEEYYEDKDYQRYFQLYSDPEALEAVSSDAEEPDEWLDDDEISPYEEAFLVGYHET